MITDKTILEVQSEIEMALQHLPGFAAQLPEVLKPLVRLAPPKGSRTQVSLRHRHGKIERQVKRNAPADSWSPRSGLVSISYNPSPQQTDALETQAADAAYPETLTQPVHVKDPATDLLLALASAERDPQLGFVSLKWFRDVYLQQQGYAWAATSEDRQRVLVDAINRKWILTSKHPNPKNPQYPVTAIKINRPLAEVRGILRQEETDSGSVFVPITIVGEPLSETVLRERR
ncbi:MAG: hypothetical protein HY649_00735 [Acidobacteria bacterium]|nr:hypothetical protein [Acidobacteriota bacterium]